MNDRKLLEAAAKAVGIDLNNYEWIEGEGVATYFMGAGDASHDWNPLENDGDAFCLMVDLDLKLYIQPDADKPYTIACDSELGQYQAWASCEHGPDKRAAARRAIVMAAADKIRVKT